MRHEHAVRVASIGLEAWGDRTNAALLGARPTISAVAASPSAMDEDRAVDRVSPVGIRADRIHPACDLVAERDRERDACLRAIDDVQVRVADPAAGDPNPDLGAGRLRNRDLFGA